MVGAPVAVGGFDKGGAGGQGLHHLAHGHDRSEGAQADAVDAVVGPPPRHDLEPALVAPIVVVVLGQLHGRFHRFGAAALKDEPVDAGRGNSCQDLGQFHGRDVGKAHRGEVGQTAHLVIGRLGQLFGAVPHVNRPGHPGVQVQVALSVLVIYPHALAFDDDGNAVSDFLLAGSMQNQVGGVIQFFNRFFHLPLLDWHFSMPEILIKRFEIAW